MLSGCRRLTHLPRWYKTATPLFTRPTTIKCKRTSCMSPARLVTTSPEGTKRRRLTSPSPTRNKFFSSMAPLLIQEVEDEHAAPAKIQLIAVEETLCSLLLDVAAYIDSTPPPPGSEASKVTLPPELAKQPLILRFAGGWVRDKLLGVQSHDIDVAINKMTGEHFGLRLKEYLENPGNLEKYGLESIARDDKQSQKAGATDKSKVVGGLHKIKVNPEKSKNLETTTMRLLGLDVDLVNLRKETYTDNSRNPEIEFGTPEEDAIRRDATVNSMFYNVNTGEIEDFTGRGHEDMRKKLIRTPLEPYQTFKDDPLRVLRLIRFASRLGYTIDPPALEAMRNPDIKDALRRKISRERVGIEMDKSLQGPDPHEALRLIFELDLYDTIYSDPAVANSEHYIPDTNGWQTVIDTLEDIISNDGTLLDLLIRDLDERFLAWQLAALVPYRDAPQPEPSAPGKKLPPPVAVTVAREGVKATNKMSDVILSAIRNQEEIVNLVDRLYQKKRRPDKKLEGDDPAARDILGMAMRRWGASWRSQVVYSMLVEIATSTNQVEAIERKYIIFVEHLQSLNILDACSLKPLLDGKQLAKAINISPGPWMKDALDVVMAWQLRNPDVTDPQQAIEEVKIHQANGELTSDLIRHFLKLTIRPLFLKATPASITAQGRKVTTEQLPQKLSMANQDQSNTQPWKKAKDSYALEVLDWSILSLDDKIIAEVWPLVVPPIMTLLDDGETKYKRKGAMLLNALLKRTPSSLLSRTGLGDVFEEALMQCLTYLPTLTPEDEATALLSTVYPTLITLSDVRYPPSAESSRQRIKFFDKVLRKGILYGYEYCSAYPEIVRILFINLSSLFDKLCMDTVKHIKYVLPVLTQSLSHPLSKASTSMLDSAIQALQALIRNAWPRMVEWRGDVLKGVCFCWLNINETKDEATAIKQRLKETVQLLAIVLKERDECDFEADCETLIDADPRLEELLLTNAVPGASL